MEFLLFREWQEILHPTDRGKKYYRNGILHTYYYAKNRICAKYKPESILEIGVRYGYSAHAFLCAVPEARYYGVDKINGGHGGAKGNPLSYANKMLCDNFPEADITTVYSDTQEITIWHDHFDFIHIDGEHTHDGCMHDLKTALTANPAVILIDDYKYLAEVKKAVDSFIAEYGDMIKKYYYVESLRGEMILELKHEKPQ